MRVLFNPNKWSDEGTVSLSAFAPAPNGEYVVYGRCEDGSDWKTLHVRDLDTGNDLDETIRWVKFSTATWTPDGEGFYYGRYPVPKEGRSTRTRRKPRKSTTTRQARRSRRTGLCTDGPTTRSWALGWR